MMNTKLRALLWEELRTGGVIAGWCVLVGFLCLAFVGIPKFFDGSQELYANPALIISFGTLFMLVPLLLYRTGNSGHLTGGFSGRILLLPMETRQAVGAILITRCLLILAVGVLVFSFCRLFFDVGPVWTVLPLIAVLYLLVQFLDWLRRPLPEVATLGLVGLITFLAFGYTTATQIVGTNDEGNFFERIYYTLGEASTYNTVEFPISMSSALAALALTAGVTYLLSLLVVNLERRGERRSIPVFSILGDRLGDIFRLRSEGFASPRRAMLWRFFVKDAGLFSLMAFGLTVVFLGIGYTVSQTIDLGERSRNLFLGASTQGEYLPWLALFLAAVLWGGIRSGAGIRRGERRSLTDYLYPQSSAAMTANRLLGHGLLLLAVWSVLLMVSNAIFLTADSGFMWRIYTDALANGETDLQEVMHTRLFIPFVALLASWVLMAVRTRLLSLGFALGIIVVTTIGVSQELLDYRPSHYDVVNVGKIIGVGAIVLIGGCLFAAWRGFSRRVVIHIGAWGYVLLMCIAMALGQFDYLTQGFWSLVAVAIVLPLAGTFWAFRRSLIPRRHLVTLTASWLGAILFVYPFGAWELSGFDRESLILAVLVGALVVLPYPALILDFHRRRHQDDSAQDPAEHTSRSREKLTRPIGITVAGALVVFGLGAVWLRWPAEPAYYATFRAQGLPATKVDLAESYAPGPPEINAAFAYLDVMAKNAEREKDWEEIRLQKESNPATARAYSDRNNVTRGIIPTAPDALVWEADWAVAKERYALVEAHVSPLLANINKTTYTQCRFPIDVGSEDIKGFGHISAMRQLIRAEAFAMWIAAVEDRPDEVLHHLPTAIAAAEALREEPFLISQMVRMAMHEVVVASVEQALSRTEFTDAQLQSMQNQLEQALPPVETQPLVPFGITGELAAMGQIADTNLATGEVYKRAGILSQSGYFQLNRIVILRALIDIMKNDSTLETPLARDLDHVSNPYATLAQVLAPAFDRTREGEWRCRLNNDMAATACAVERYRLANGALPTTLEALVPTYMDQIPTDLFREDGGPISYRADADGGFRVYSWSRDGKDDQGEPGHSKGWRDGDGAFRVASPEFRNGPQLTDERPTEEERKRR